MKEKVTEKGKKKEKGKGENEREGHGIELKHQVFRVPLLLILKLKEYAPVNEVAEFKYCTRTAEPESSPALIVELKQPSSERYSFF